MSTIFDNDILIHHIAAPGLPGSGFTVPEAAALRNDIDTLLARPAITELDAIPDVDVASAVDGDVLLYDAGSDGWTAGAVGGTIERIDNGDTPSAIYDVGWVRLQNGIVAEPHPTVPAVTIIRIAYGATATTVAAGNHIHAVPVVARSEFTPQGYMSASTRPLTSLNVGLPAGKICLVEAKLKMQLRGGDPGASYYVLNLSIDGNTRSSAGGVNGFWCVQGVPDKPVWAHDRTITGTGATINVAASISWNSGGGFYTDAGELEVTISYNR